MAVLLGVESDECDACAGLAGSLWQGSSVCWGRIPPPSRADLWCPTSSDWQELLTAFQIHPTTSVKMAVRYQSLTIDMLSVLRVNAVETDISVCAGSVFCASVPFLRTIPIIFTDVEDLWDLRVKCVIFCWCWNTFPS